ncbi:MAG: DUF86 domain-containing protein [Candidatus Parcubacteria bacterium]|nr:DUF86 domain-containing protein [Candidatus Parcubacteria bacterium]
MLNEILIKKIEQIDLLLRELEEFTSSPFEEFQKNISDVRASERNFQLIVDLASDVNTEILLKRGHRAPDTYKQSFLFLADAGVLTPNLSQELAGSAVIRNILVHEYDIDEDTEAFYREAKRFLPIFREYLKEILTQEKT